MPRSLRQLVAPAYLFLSLVLGGSAQGIWSNATLQLLGLALIAWAAIQRPAIAPGSAERQLMLLFAAGVVVAALQLVPLPFDLWRTLGPRDGLSRELGLIGLTPGAMPLSLAPYSGLQAILALIPPLALFLAITRLHASRIAFLVASLIAGTVLGILLGIFQVTAAEPENSPFYLYPRANWGVATGFFANANHMAALLLACLPFLAAVTASARDGHHPRARTVAAVAAALALLVIVGLVLNGSMAGYLLLVPVGGASALIALRMRTRVRRLAILVVAGAVAIAIAVLGSRSIGEDIARGPADSRGAIVRTTAAATAAHFPYGAGLGSFVDTYHLYEDPDSVGTTFVVHAHNDFAELALELGLPGIIIMVLFLAWWARAAIESWRSPEGQPYVRAAAVVSGALLAHSLVDFPLRGAAMSGVFALSLALLAVRGRRDPLDPSALRPTRHVAID